MFPGQQGGRGLFRMLVPNFGSSHAALSFLPVDKDWGGACKIIVGHTKTREETKCLSIIDKTHSVRPVTTYSPRMFSLCLVRSYVLEGMATFCASCADGCICVEREYAAFFGAPAVLTKNHKSCAS